MYFTTHNNINYDAIFEKGKLGVDELLDSDTVITKFRNGDEKLVNYISRPEILCKLIEIALGFGLEGDRQWRHPLVACEILCCEQVKVSDTLDNYPECFSVLWNLPTTGQPSILFLKNWCRLLDYYLLNMPFGILKSFKSNPTVIDGIVKLVHLPEIIDTLTKIIAIDENGDILSWLKGENFFSKLFASLLKPIEQDYEKYFGVQLFVLSCLSFNFTEEFPMHELVKIFINELDKVIGEILTDNLNQELFSSFCEIFCGMILRVVSSRESPNNQLYEPLTTEITGLILPFFPLLDALLKSNPSASAKGPHQQYQSPSGSISPVGMVRITTVKLLGDLILLNDERLVKQFKDSNTCSSILGLFFLHQHNNILHANVLDFLQNIFNGPFNLYRDLILSIFKDGKLISRIVKVQRLNDASIQRPRGCRLANIGHVTLICDLIFKLVEGNEEASTMLKDELNSADWKEFCEGTYRETKIKDTISLGGSKPPVTIVEDIPSTKNNFNGIFSSTTDEQLARYFCQQVISHLPNRFVFLEEGDDNDEEEEGEDFYTSINGIMIREDEIDEIGDPNDIIDNQHPESIEIPIGPNGLTDTILEMEMRMSSLDDFTSDNGSGSEVGSTDDEPSPIE